jgi:6-phosphogluconolactonase
MRVIVGPDPEGIADRARDTVVATLRDAVERRGAARLVLSGGATPRRLYQLLGGPGGLGDVGRSTDFEFADERFVGPDSPDSNFRLVEESLLAGGSVPRDRVHPVPTGAADPEAAARQYETELRRRLPPTGPSFDLALLGIGPDGHVASLFPGGSALDEVDRWVAAVPRSPQPPYLPRITLTLPLLNRSRRAMFLVTGTAKAGIVRQALEPPAPTAAPLPANRVAGLESTEWFLDAAAARGLESPVPPSVGP